jgi:hypothetical protein
MSVLTLLFQYVGPFSVQKETLITSTELRYLKIAAGFRVIIIIYINSVTPIATRCLTCKYDFQ